MANWKVTQTAKAEEELKRLIILGEVSKADMCVLRLWLDEMEDFGPDHIAASPNWHDHPLEREWWGFRASAFSAKGRIIYRLLGKFVIVEIHKITVSHNYKR